MVSGSVCVVTSFVIRNNWFSATSNLRFQQSFVTITLGKIQIERYFILYIFTIVVTNVVFIFNQVGDCYIFSYIVG